SCTKAFAATAVALLVDDGKMSWDDPVRRHLPYFHLADPLADAQVTVRDLLCHRTGLSRHDALLFHLTRDRLGTPAGQEDVLRRVAHLQLTRPFRSAWQYNNLMYMASGRVVTAVAGRPWDDFA